MIRKTAAAFAILAALAPAAYAGQAEVGNEASKSICEKNAALAARQGIDCTPTQAIGSREVRANSYPPAPVTFASGITF